MTSQRRDHHSTEFGLYLRTIRKLDSKMGYQATNLDYIWRNYRTGQWMLIEEKRYKAEMKQWQRETFQVLDAAIRASGDFNYRGFVFLQFERTCPSDGRIWWNGKEVTENELQWRLAEFVV